MKVLMVNKFYYPVGGPELVVRHTSDALRREGHEIIIFAMRHPDNWPSEWSDYFVSNVDYKGGSYGPLRLLQEAARIIYSTEAKRQIERLIADTRPDIAHLHNIYHQLSPSILPPLKKNGVATVLTLHDAKLLCPAEHMFIHGDICERCRGSRFYNCFAQKCIKDSRAKSLLCTVEMYVHRLMGIYERNIDLFIAPSEFYRRKMIESGRVHPDRILTIHTYINVDSRVPTEPGDYALYLGRVDAHKGAMTLMQAMRKCPGVRLKVVGRGDAVDECLRFIEEKQMKNVEMLGFLTGDELEASIRDASFLITPSEWYENCPQVVLEAAAYGKPAIVTNLGGMPELVDDGESGFIVQPRNPDELAERITLLGSDRELVRKMGNSARGKAEREFSHPVHYRKLMDAYSLALDISHQRSVNK